MVVTRSHSRALTPQDSSSASPPVRDSLSHSVSPSPSLRRRTVSGSLDAVSSSSFSTAPQGKPSRRDKSLLSTTRSHKTFSSSSTSPSDADSDELGAKQPVGQRSRLSDSTPFPKKCTMRTRSSMTWAHQPSLLALLWISITLPLVLLDSAYILGRPHTLPGGRLHKPLFSGYKKYGSVDLLYGAQAWEDSVGFAAAQSIMNVIECVGYTLYLIGIWLYKSNTSTYCRPAISGRTGGVILLLGLISATMTWSKTLLYLLTEACSNFHSTRHNEAFDLIVWWIIPITAWILFPFYIIVKFSREATNAFEMASITRVPNRLSRA